MKQVRFGTYNSYDDLNMFLTEKVDVPPVPDRSLVKVPGRNGLLDLNKGTADYVTYSNRQVTLTFAIEDYSKDWDNIFADIKQKLHGREMKVYMDGNAYYYDAFVTVASDKAEGNMGEVVVVLDAYPYELLATPTTKRATATAAGTTVTCSNSDMPVSPKLTSTGAFKVSANGVEYAYSEAGTYSPPGIMIKPGGSQLKLTGSNVTVTISYNEGRL